MLIALLATLMFFAMLAATFNGMRNEMQEARVRIRNNNARSTSTAPRFDRASW